MLSGTRTWLNQSVKLYPYSSTNSYGEYSHGTGATIACRIVMTNEEIITEHGTSSPVNAKVYVDGSVSVSVKDEIELPGESPRPIQKVSAEAGPDGNDYLKVLYV